MKLTTKKDIVKLLNTRSSPSSLNSIKKILKLPEPAIKMALQSLIHEKIIVKKGKLYQITETNKTKIIKKPLSVKKNPLIVKQQQSSFHNTGTIQSHPDGYAFFIPLKGKGDLFIPPSRLNGAMHGDKVIVRRAKFKGRFEAHVIEILERKNNHIVARILVRRRHYMATPLGTKFIHPLFIRKGSTQYFNDDVVLCKIVAYPDKDKDAEAEIIKKIGNLNDKGIENLIVMAKHDLNIDFQTDVIQDVDASVSDIKNNPPRGYTDLTNLLTITIDNETAKDFDDAISLIKSSSGYKLYVHIADVSLYVSANSLTNVEAFERGCSVYFPEFAIPMLPEKLSADECSLVPNKNRYCLSVEIDYDKKGIRKKYKFIQSIIKSKYRLTYNKVNSVLSGQTDGLENNLVELLNNARDLMRLINNKRREKGTIDFDLPEVGFLFNTDGSVKEIVQIKRGISERIIEHFMIEANECSAEYLEDKSEASIFRTHDKPDPLKIKNWCNTAEIFDNKKRLIPEVLGVKDVQNLFNSIDDGPSAYFLKSILIRSMQRAEYTTDNIGHFGLASESYTHFTSPIRRYPDLIVHRLIKKYCFGVPLELSKEKLEIMSEHCSVKERSSEEAEREITTYKKLFYLKQKFSESHPAYISKIVSTGFYVFLTDILIGGYIDAATLPKGYYHFNIEQGLVEGRRGGVSFSLGEQLQVMWLKNDMDKLEAEFYIPDENPKKSFSKKKRRRKN